MPKTKRRKPKAPILDRADRTFGLILVVFSSINICWGSIAAIVGGIVGRQSGPHSGFGSLQLVICGGIGAVVAVVQAFAGILVMGSSRRGFIIAALCSSISIVLGIFSLPYGALSILCGAIIVHFCRVRLTGKQGPPLSD